MKHNVMIIVAVLIIAASMVISCVNTTTVLFESDFNDVENTLTFRKALGTDWYWGRFEPFQYGGTLTKDIHIVADPAPFGNICLLLEDEVGVLFQVDTRGYDTVELRFDWYTLHTLSYGNTLTIEEMASSGVSVVDTKDRFVCGYYVGELDFFNDQGAADFVEICGGEDAVRSWWEDEWIECIRDASADWVSTGPVKIPGGESSVWIAFWMDDGETHFAAIDNIEVLGLHRIEE